MELNVPTLQGGFGSQVAVTVQGCQIACELTVGCDSFSYNGAQQACFLKNGASKTTCPVRPPLKCYTLQRLQVKPMLVRSEAEVRRAEENIQVGWVWDSCAALLGFKREGWRQARECLVTPWVTLMSLFERNISHHQPKASSTYLRGQDLGVTLPPLFTLIP